MLNCPWIAKLPLSTQMIWQRHRVAVTMWDSDIAQRGTFKAFCLNGLFFFFFVFTFKHSCHNTFLHQGPLQQREMRAGHFSHSDLIITTASFRFLPGDLLRSTQHLGVSGPRTSVEKLTEDNSEDDELSPFPLQVYNTVSFSCLQVSRIKESRRRSVLLRDCNIQTLLSFKQGCG